MAESWGVISTLAGLLWMEEGEMRFERRLLHDDQAFYRVASRDSDELAFFLGSR